MSDIDSPTPVRTTVFDSPVYEPGKDRPVMPGWVERVAWAALSAAVTAALIPVRERIGTAQVALLYLLIVLFASARCGRLVGLLLAGASFVAFNFFFVVPYGTLSVLNPSDWLVLIAFLVTSAVAAQLLHRSQSEAAAATRRTFEVQRLATLGADALQSPRAEDAAAAIARVIREELHVETCELYLQRPPTEQLRLVACATATTAETYADTDDGDHSVAELILSTDSRTLIVPLHVRSRQVGLLRLRSDNVIPPDVARHPFAEALAYYAALGLERIRLTAAAEHADALREADTLKDELLAAVSHDLRTPLTTIKAIAHEIALDGDPRATVVEIEADRLNRYVSNLLDLSRLNAGALRVTPELVPIEDLIGATLQQAAGVIGARTISVTLSESVPMLVGRLDFALTLRALGNLIENALRYSPASTAVDIHASVSAGRIQIDVADRGPGILAADEERIFEPFQRASLPADAHGTGLGLAIARRILEAQDGTLTYTPRSGGGSVFTISIPGA